MLTMLKRGAAIAAVVALSAACAHPPKMGPHDAYFGDAVNNNATVQLTNPEPQPEAGPPPFNGQRAWIAMQRYQYDKVKEPASLDISGIAVISAGGGGGE